MSRLSLAPGVSIPAGRRGIYPGQTWGWSQRCWRDGAWASRLRPLCRWCDQELCPVAMESERGSYEAGAAQADSALVYEGSPARSSRL